MKKLSLVLISVLLSACGAPSGTTPSNERRSVAQHVEAFNSAPLTASERTISRDNAVLRKNGQTERRIEIPHDQQAYKHQRIERTGYTVAYEPEWRIPVWVAYELTASEASAQGDRGSGFEPDPDVQGKRAYPTDYSHSGYDRGHMAPAGDMKWNRRAMQESFLLSNVCPQHHELNTGVWNDLENLARRWARRYGHVWICMGPIVSQHHRTIGHNDVAVPERFFKVFCRQMRNGRYEAVGYVFDNASCPRRVESYAVSVDYVEQITGLDFFPAVPDAAENSMERNSRSW